MSALTSSELENILVIARSPNIIENIEALKVLHFHDNFTDDYIERKSGIVVGTLHKLIEKDPDGQTHYKDACVRVSPAYTALKRKLESIHPQKQLDLNLENVNHDDQRNQEDKIYMQWLKNEPLLASILQIHAALLERLGTYFSQYGQNISLHPDKHQHP